MIPLLFLAAVSFAMGGVAGTLLKDMQAQQREHKVLDELKEAKAEILRLRAQVALHIGGTA